MEDIISILKRKPDFLSGKGSSPSTITDIENELGLSFAEDYKQYLLVYGIAAFDGIELTGITSVQRVNVRSVTEKNRELCSVPGNFYVIEEAGIDGIVIWQDSNGSVYKTFPGCEKPIPIYKSFAEYIESI